MDLGCWRLHTGFQEQKSEMSKYINKSAETKKNKLCVSLFHQPSKSKNALFFVLQEGNLKTYV